jgi:flagellar FliL protein
MAESTDNHGEKKADAGPKKPPINVTNLLLIIVIGVLLLAVIGGGIAAVMIVRSGNHVAAPAEAAADANAEEEKADKPAKGEKPGQKPKEAAKPAKEKKEEPKAPAIYVQLEPPFVVNFQAGKPAKFLQITMEIMTRDPATAQVLKENNPLLRNDVLMLFGAQQYEVVSVQEGRESLRQQTLDAVRGVVKKEGGKPAEVEAVYFTSFVMQ